MCTASNYITKKHYFGRNFDYEISYNEKVTIAPRNYKFDFKLIDSIDSHYAMIGIAAGVDAYPLYYDACNGWNRSTQNFALPIPFADESSVLVSGAYSGRVFTTGGIKTNGTQFEAQILGGQAMSSDRTLPGWNVYVAGYGRS